MQENHITVSRTARFFTIGNINGPLKEVWFVCHGQGQLAAYFIKHFKAVDDGSRLIVAPEALSRFYLDNGGGRIGACWMTREDRLNEIEDYTNYLDELYRKIFSQLGEQQPSVHVLGFSQSVATVCRWLNRGNVKADRLTLWAGQIPNEFDADANKEIFRKLNITMVVGEQDEFANALAVAEQRAILDKHDIRHRLITFEGKHQLNEKVLQELG